MAYTLCVFDCVQIICQNKKNMILLFITFTDFVGYTSYTTSIVIIK